MKQDDGHRLITCIVPKEAALPALKGLREAWQIAIQNRHRPTALVLTRQNVPTLDRTVYAPATERSST